MPLSKIQTADMLDTPNLGRRNLIINGDMRIAQRGTSQTNSGYNSIDRYNWALSGSTATFSQQSMSATDRASTGFQYYARMAVSTANNNAGFYYLIEAKDLANCHGKKMTVTFLAKGQNPAGGNFIFNHYWYDSSSGNADNGVTQNVTITSSTEWRKYTVTFDLATASNVDITSNTARYDIALLQPAGDTSTTAWTLDFTGLQMEVGETATDFEHRGYGEELALCQRYYTEIQKASGQTVNASTIQLCGVFPTEMRATPSASLSGALTIWQLTVAGSKAQSSSNINVDSNINSASVFNAQCGNFSGLTQHQGVAVAGGNQPLKFSAEL